MPRNKQWTDLDMTILRDLYPNHSTKAVAYALQRSEKSVYYQAHLLGLHKSPEYLASDLSGRIQRGKKDPRLKGSQFQKGFTPWNKGVKGYQPGGRAAETQFKAGRPASEARNYLPIGSLRLNSKDGYLQQKLTDDPSIVPAQRWRSVHRIVWEAAHGPVPPGHIVVFKTKALKTSVLEEITLDRLECISRKENVRRNSYWTNYPPEVARLVQLKGAINRQANRIAQESQQ